MKKKVNPNQVVQISVTMQRHLKEKYAKLAVEKDLSLSQLIRLALKKILDDTKN
tara:strand:- start:242 stop:403 length:162 start_codon:yes stop_codon:yes gene_type:complete